MKNRKVVILIIFVIVILMIGGYYFLFSRDNEEKSIVFHTQNNIFDSSLDNYFEVKDEISVSQVIEISDAKDPLRMIYRVEDEDANIYSLSYTKNILSRGDKLIKGNDVSSDQLYILFRESYPNITLKEMGVDSEEEAYQALQLAIWEIAARTGEAKNKLHKDSYEPALKQVNRKVYNASRDLVNKASAFTLENDYNLVMIPTLVINTKSVERVENEDLNGFLYGPYKYHVESSALVSTDINLTLDGEKDEGEIYKIVDIDGNEINDYTNVEEFYIYTSKYFTGRLVIDVYVTAKKLMPRIYFLSDQDYIASSYELVSMQENVSIKVD